MAAWRIQWLVLLSIGSGCVRAGFAVGDGSAPAAPERSPAFEKGSIPSPESSPPAHSATAAQDTCATALTVDAAKLPISIGVNTSGAHADFSFIGCNGIADLVLRFTSTPKGSIALTCSGGGRLGYGHRQDGGCGGPINGWGSMDCTGTSFGTTTLATPTAHLIVCREPSAGPALLTLKKGF